MCSSIGEITQLVHSHPVECEPLSAHFLTVHANSQTSVEHCVNSCKNCADDIFILGKSLYQTLKAISTSEKNLLFHVSLSLASLYT